MILILFVFHLVIILIQILLYLLVLFFFCVYIFQILQMLVLFYLLCKLKNMLNHFYLVHYIYKRHDTEFLN